jgi:hypothetical protein
MVKDYLFKKPNQKPTSQVSPHQDRKYDEKSKLFEPKPVTKTIPADFVADAKFSAELTVPDQYDEIQFTDDTLGTVEWHWDFGDGFTSTEQNPTHVYPGGAGSKYTVTLIVKDKNDKVGISVKTDYIQVQNDKYINEQLSGKQLLISLQNKVDPDQTKWADVRDSSNNNVYTIGYSNDQPDTTAINNNVSGDPYIESFYGTGDTIISTEGNGSLQLKFLLNDLIGEFQTSSINSTHYDLASHISSLQSDSIYAAFLCRNLTSGRQVTFNTNPNSRTEGVNTIDNIVNRRDFDSIRAGQTLGTGYLPATDYIFVEVYGDGNFQTVAVNGVFSFFDNDFNMPTTSTTIYALFGEIKSNDQFVEFVVSNDPNDRLPYKSYINDKYGTSF